MRGAERHPSMGNLAARTSHRKTSFGRVMRELLYAFTLVVESARYLVTTVCLCIIDWYVSLKSMQRSLFDGQCHRLTRGRSHM